MTKTNRGPRLLEHAREVAGQIRKFTFSLLPEIRTEASQKLSYGKQVVSALDRYIENPGPLTDEASRDVLYQVMVSARPTLITAIEELEAQLASESYFTVPDRDAPPSAPFDDAPVLDLEALEREMRATDEEYRRAVEARERRAAEEDTEEDTAEEDGDAV
jgi:hypothetical protein